MQKKYNNNLELYIAYV